jgi:predicted nucleic acid-binding protein
LNDLCQADAIQIQTAMAEKCDFIVTADEQLAESGEKLGREQSPSRTAEDCTN